MCLIKTYVSFAGITCKQHTGIPMGGNASLDITDLTLATMEYKNFSIQLPQGFFLFRYIDDILIVNYHNFEDIIRTLHDSSLQVEKKAAVV